MRVFDARGLGDSGRFALSSKSANQAGALTDAPVRVPFGPHQRGPAIQTIELSDVLCVEREQAYQRRVRLG